MLKPPIHGNRRVLSASTILRSIGDDLSQIKHEDGVTWADMGRVLGKSEDQVAKYADGSAEMGVTTYYFGKQAWGGRFCGSADRLITDAAHDAIHDRARETSLLECALNLSIALADDDQIDVDEIRRNRAIIETARSALDGLLAKLTPKEVMP